MEEDLLLAIRDAGSVDTRQLRILIFARNVERGFDRMTEISRLKSIVETLRSENGCSWDKVQTHSSLKAACIMVSETSIKLIDVEDLD